MKLCSIWAFSLMNLISLHKTRAVVVEVNITNYFSFFGDHPSLLEFYAPWCPNCAKFEKSYDFVSKQLRISDEEFKIGRIDTATNPALASLYTVEYIPMFYLYRDNKLYKLRETLSANGIIDFCKEGYKHENPMSLATSPLGPIGQMKSGVLRIGLHLYNIVEYFAVAFDIEQWQSIVLTLLLGAVVLLGIMVVMVLLAVNYLKLL